MRFLPTTKKGDALVDSLLREHTTGIFKPLTRRLPAKLQPLLLLVLVACGGQVSQGHLAAVQVSRSLISSMANVYEEVCTLHQAEVIYRDKGVEAFQVYRNRCVAAGVGQHALVEAWDEWVDTLLAAEAGEPFDLVRAVSAAKRLVRIYGEVRPLILALGGDIPELPQVVIDMAAEDL